MPTRDWTEFLLNSINASLDAAITPVQIYESTMLELLNVDDEENEFLNHNYDEFAIYQLKSEPINDGILFMNSSYLEQEGIPIDLDRYEFKYNDKLEVVTGKIRRTLRNEARVAVGKIDTEGILDGIYEYLNFRKPADYHCRSVSVSDIIALRQDGKLEYYYVDSIGFKKVEV